PHEAVVIPDW
ncbi:hypothetical protein EE612_017026, partial [Oryza sativa]